VCIVGTPNGTTGDFLRGFFYLVGKAGLILIYCIDRRLVNHIPKKVAILLTLASDIPR